MKKRLKPISKKGKFPGGFLLFFLVVILAILTFQSLSDDKSERVSFSHQLEHLVNLNLIKPEENKKVAQNDNLVTFSGKFREMQMQDSREKFDYLELLNKQHELAREKEEAERELDLLQKEVKESAFWFLNITGYPIPSSGFFVVGKIYDTSSKLNSIVIRRAPSSDIVNLKEIENKFYGTKESPGRGGFDEVEGNLKILVQLFRSPRLGISNEKLKQQLKDLEVKLNDSKDTDKKELLSTAISELGDIADLLGRSQDNVRLLTLRSVRSYLEEIEEYRSIIEKLETSGALLEKARQNVGDAVWFFNNKEVSTRTLEAEDPEIFSHWFFQAKREWESFNANKGLQFRAPDQPRNLVLEKTFKSEEPSPNYFSYIFTILPILLVILALYFIFARQMKGVGSSAMNFGKSTARLLTKEDNKTTFKDVAGLEEAKEELKEIVDFLKDPRKFTLLGARIPKGVLLVGSPGTGKTLIAKAVAGEADRPFFSISGSDFVEMFVGVGASRIRDLFGQAKRNAPCIIFIDEIDAVGRHRGAGIGGGHDEREQTLNQLLVEMDGFDTKEGVILMAATNRPDILDKALLRPGRFDRRVVLDLPDIRGRYEILKVHARRIKIDPSVDLMDIAKNTPGASGADLENILNEAALLAARRGRLAVTKSEAMEACDKVRFGKERRSLEMDAEEKKMTAFHESGHAIVSLKVTYSDPIDKVTIIPRGFALGATHFMPKKNRISYWKKEVLDQLAILMGGRAAEEIFLGDMSSGAQQDINQATRLVRAMVCEWGMSEELGMITYDEKMEAGQYLGLGGYHEKKYSEETAEKIDREVHSLIETAHKKALEIVEREKDKVKQVADMLMEFETLDAKDIEEIMEGSWDPEKKKERLKIAEELQKKPSPKTQEEKKVKKDLKIQEA